jgi:hypothetical protein
MMLRSSLCAFAALLLWTNVSNACDSAHEPDISLNLVQQERQDIIAAQAAASFMAVEAELAADADRITDYAVPDETWTRQANIGAYVLAVEAELTANADRSVEVAISTSLLDHEGESVAGIITSEMAAPIQQSDENTVGQPVNLSLSQADAPVLRFPVEVEEIAAFSPAAEQPFEPDTTGSIPTGHEEGGLALDEYEDR